MTNYAAGDAFQRLKDSLEGEVLSEGFKRRVLVAALDAYNKGFEAGKASADPATGLTPQVVPAFEPSLPASTLTTNTPDVILDVLRDSIDSGCNVRIDYVDRYGERTYDREVEPEEFTLGEAAVVARDVEKDEYRQFSLGRIQSLTVGG